MSGRKAIERATQRAQYRDKKRRTKMKVTGISVKTLSRLLGRSK